MYLEDWLMLVLVPVIPLLGLLGSIFLIFVPLGKWGEKSRRYRFVHLGGMASLMVYLIPSSWGFQSEVLYERVPVSLVVPVAVVIGIVTFNKKSGSRVGEGLVAFAALLSFVALAQSVWAYFT